jgi:hypothetical protein
MLCLRCGFSKQRHCRADGSCIDAQCEAFVEKWMDEAAPVPSPAPVKAETPSTPVKLVKPVSSDASEK